MIFILLPVAFAGGFLVGRRCRKTTPQGRKREAKCYLDKEMVGFLNYDGSNRE